MSVNANLRFTSRFRVLLRPLQGLSKLIIKNVIMSLTYPPLFSESGFRTSGPFCMRQKLFIFLIVRTCFCKKLSSSQYTILANMFSKGDFTIKVFMNRISPSQKYKKVFHPYKTDLRFETWRSKIEGVGLRT